MVVLCFVEEPSAEAALASLLPKLLPEAVFQFIIFQGKRDLLLNIHSRLRGYANWLPEDWRIIVLVDEDREDCQELKRQLESASLSAGFVSKSQAGGGSFQVLNRIAVEELEAWFLGDVEALRQVYPRLPASLANRQRFRDPDRVVGGTWESLESLLQAHGYYPAGYPKLEAARQISQHMVPDRNHSHSFQIFIQGLQAL